MSLKRLLVVIWVGYKHRMRACDQAYSGKLLLG
jgi:hypothetical protein